MEIEILSNLEGDKKKSINTSTEEGRKAAEQFVKKLLKGGTALFLEVGKETYRIVGYDPKRDALTIQVNKNGKTREAKAKSSHGRKTAVPARAGG